MKSTGSPAVEIENLTRRFGETTALDDVCLSIEHGEFFSLLGPSGCGKTTLLRIIAGLDLADSGTVRIGGRDARGIPAHRRPVNTVFQSYALFPHLNVWDNIAFGLRMKKVPELEIQRRVRDSMALVEVESLAQRRPSQLSGGQKQRVALARALINEPQVLLLDEPLGALDLKLRKQLQSELLNLQRRLQITFIYVTHDQEEALVLSHRMAVMRHGKVDQIGDPRSLYEHPRTRFTSQFLGTCSILEARFHSSLPNGALVDTPVGPLRVQVSVRTNQPLTLAIRPEKVQLSPLLLSGQENCVPARIRQLIYVGAETHYELEAGGQLLRAEVMNTHAGEQGMRVGQQVQVRLPPDALILLDD